MKKQKTKPKHGYCDCGGVLSSKGSGRLRCSSCRKTKKQDNYNTSSALLDSEGNTILRWVKNESRKVNELELLEDVLVNIDKLVKPAKKRKHKKPSKNDLISVYTIADFHHGMLAWKRECGHDYDTYISSENLDNGFSYLSNIVGCDTSHALILQLGDFFHIDDQRNVTPKSGNQLDVDSRYQRIIETGISSFISCIEMALDAHDTVHVVICKGNHDLHSSVALSASLNAYYRNEPRITIDTEPTEVKYYTFGSNLFTATHGDKIKSNKIKDIITTDKPELWGKSKTVVAFSGHLHHKKIIQENGITVEQCASAAPRDAFATNYGWRSEPEIQRIDYSRNNGEVARYSYKIGKEY